MSSGSHGTNAPSGADRSSAGVARVSPGPVLRTWTATLSTPGRGVVNVMSSRSRTSRANSADEAGRTGAWAVVVMGASLDATQARE